MNDNLRSEIKSRSVMPKSVMDRNEKLRKQNIIFDLPKPRQCGKRYKEQIINDLEKLRK